MSLELAWLMEEIRKKFWSFVRLNRTENMGIPILSDIDGLHITSPAKAEAPNNRFAPVFTCDNSTDMIDKGPYGETTSVSHNQGLRNY